MYSRVPKQIVTLAVMVLMTLGPSTAFAQINIWEGTACRHRVEMTPYLANGDKSIAVIVCPGGSYFWHDMKNEGRSVADWLQQNGISAFLLKYRTAQTPAFLFRYRYVFRGIRYPDAQNDLRQALSLIRQRAREYGIDPDRTGVMGFSAGGHLAMSGAELFPQHERPSFVASIYPVVSLTDKCVHKRSRRALLGDSRKNNQALRQQLSLEQNVPADCPPVFLVNCIDDPVVEYRHSVLLDSALSVHGIPHVYIQYQAGGHGFGASSTKGTSECRRWKEAFIKWIHSLYR